jgi:archaellum component FlaC
MKNIIVKLLPIILVSILFLYKEETIDFSHSILGRLVAVSIIFFYISCNIWYGLLACLLIILYYQFDFVESRSDINMINLEGFQEGADNSVSSKFDEKIESKLVDIKNDIKNLKSDIKGFKTDITDFKTDISNVKADINTVKTDISTLKTDVTTNSTDILKIMNNPPKKETSGFTNYSDLYDELKKEPNTKNQITTYFRNQNCKNGELKFKNITVKNEIAPHIFPELKYEREPCNVCSDTCKFSIIEEKMRTEDNIVKPVNSNNVFQKTPKTESKEIPSIGVVSEPFSTYK